MEPLLIQGGRIIDPSQGMDKVADLFIAGGRVSWISDEEGKGLTPSEPCLVLDAQGMIVSPGFIDLHCHLREPGFEEKETIATGTRAAAAGGFTTLCCMPNTNPSIDTRATVEYIRRKVEAEGVVRVLPIGCITRGQRGEELAEMGELAEAGVVAFSDDGRPVESPQLMRYALDYSRAFGLPIIEHCEELSLTEGGLMNEGWIALRLGLKGIPAAGEEVAVARDISLAQLTGARLHIAHVSTAGSVELIRRAKEKGISVTAEVTPHHLTLTEGWVMGETWAIDSTLTETPCGLLPLAYDTNTKVNPPLRTLPDIRALIQGLKDGTIDIIATDHAPHASTDKMCEYEFAAPGISGLETALGTLMTLVHRGKLDLITLISKLTLEPARILGRELGTLRVGAPGDVALFHPEAEWRVNSESFISKGKNTPLEGCVLRGKVMATVVGGEVVYKDQGMKLERVLD